jgi:hypothetical protein
MQNLLLQTTIEGEPHDWSITRFSRLTEFLSQLRDPEGQLAFRVTARNRGRRGEPDAILSKLSELEFDQLWLFAVDAGDGLTAADRAGISRFRQLGGRLLVTRDMDLGRSVCRLDGVGAAHHFHGNNPEGNDRRPDNPTSSDIVGPSHRASAGGDFKRVRPVGHIHPVMRDRHSVTGVIQYLPAHPHEGVVNVPPGEASARVIVAGQNVTSARRFNIAVAFERSERGGRAIAQSSFHHFSNCNGDFKAGCASFEDEPAGGSIARSPEALRSTRQYVSNVAFWLAG